MIKEADKKIIYELAKPEDLQAVYNVVQHTIKTVYPKYYPMEVVDFFCGHHSVETIEKDIKNGYVSVLKTDGTIVATGCFVENHITRVYVLPEYQKRGYGTFIMKNIEAQIGEKYDKAYLDASLPAAALYEKLRFLTVKHERYPVENGVILAYEVMEKELHKISTAMIEVQDVTEMKKPKMILFDYGQTLINEQSFDGVKGTEAVLKYATKNKYNKSAEEVQAYANELNRELGRFDPEKRHLFQVEIPNHMFTKFLYESQGIEISLSPEEIDSVFWDAAAPGKPTEGIREFLAFLKENQVRTGVISNISYCGNAVAKRIHDYIPDNDFEFIIATSEYMYRKPNKHIFELALEKAELQPEEVWYVGDQYQCDIVGAGAAGLFPVWYIGAVDTKYAPKEDILIIENWKELIDLLKKSD